MILLFTTILVNHLCYSCEEKDPNFPRPVKNMISEE
mgnify:FL=1